MADMIEITQAESDAFDKMAEAFSEFVKTVEESDPQIMAAKERHNHMLAEAIEAMTIRERDFYDALTKLGVPVLSAIREARRLAKL